MNNELLSLKHKKKYSYLSWKHFVYRKAVGEKNSTKFHMRYSLDFIILGDFGF